MIYILPGFLGKKKDWDFLGVPFTYFDLMTDNEWGKTLCECADTVASIISNDDDATLIGYSLGGRIALHLLTQHPTLIKKAVIVSAHPGLIPKERPARINHDKAWATRFQNDAWSTIMIDWNKQPIFNGHQVFREEKDYLREYLARILSNWSLGYQEDLRSKFFLVETKLLWLTGEQDKKFSSLAAEVISLFPSGIHTLINDASHRVPWENQSEFLKETCNFISPQKNLAAS